MLDPAQELEPPPASFSQPFAGQWKKSRWRWLWSLPAILTALYYLVVLTVSWFAMGRLPAASGPLLLACLGFCLWVYLIALAGWALTLLIRFLKQRLGQP